MEGGRGGREGRGHVPEAEEPPRQMADAFKPIVDVELRSHEDEPKGGRAGGRKGRRKSLVGNYFWALVMHTCTQPCIPPFLPPSLPECVNSRCECGESPAVPACVLFLKQGAVEGGGREGGREGGMREDLSVLSLQHSFAPSLPPSLLTAQQTPELKEQGRG